MMEIMNLEEPSVLSLKMEECIIDLDLEKNPEDDVYEWESKIRQKFKSFIIESEQNLNSLMKWYLLSLKEEAVNFEDFRTLKVFVAYHIQFFKLSLVEINCCFVDHYLDNMEEILSHYVNFEINSLQGIKRGESKRACKRRIMSLCHKLVHVLNRYLMNKRERVCHVMMRIKHRDEPSDESKDLLNLLYGNVLTTESKDKSDLEFCRVYILYQKWKSIRNEEDHEKMDEVMYSLYGRSRYSIETSPVLNQILMIQNHNVLDTVIYVGLKNISVTRITEQYFQYIKQNIIQDSILSSEVTDVQIPDEDIISNIVRAGDLEEEELEKGHRNFIKNLFAVHLDNNNASDTELSLKIGPLYIEADCQAAAKKKELENLDVIHEIVDDDDIIEIIRCENKNQKKNTRRKRKREDPTVNFLETLHLQENVIGGPSTSVAAGRISEATAAIAIVDLTDTVDENPVQVEVVSKTGSEDQTAPAAELSEKESPESCDDIIDVVEVADSTNNIPTVAADVPPNISGTLTSDNQDTMSSISCNEFCGIVTPPFDQNPDENNPTLMGDVSKVYTNIESMQSSRETDDLSNAMDTGSLSLQAEDSILTPSGCLTPPSEVQNKSKDLVVLPSRIIYKCNHIDFGENVGDRIHCNVDVQSSGVELEYPRLDDNVAEAMLPGSEHADGYPNGEQDPRPTLSFDWDSYVPETPMNVSCTSDFDLPRDSTIESISANHNCESMRVVVSSASPDVTSTSVDVQDFDAFRRSNPLRYEDLIGDISETEEPYLANGCYEKTVGDTEWESGNVTQSNLEDAGEEHISIHEEEFAENYVEQFLVPRSASHILRAANCRESARTKDAVRPGDKITYSKWEQLSHEPRNSSNLQRIRFTSSQIVTLNRQVSNPEGAPGLDEILHGPVNDKISRTNAVINPDSNFDLFESKLPDSSDVAADYPVTSQKMNGRWKKKIIMSRYQANLSNSSESSHSQSRLPTGQEDLAGKGVKDVRFNDDIEVADLSVSTNLKALQDASAKPNPTTDQGTPKRVKRVHYTENTLDSKNSVPQLPTTKQGQHLHGILKRSSVRKGIRSESQHQQVPSRTMCKESLTQFSVEPHDSCIQGTLQLIINRMSDKQIKMWQKNSERARKTKLEKEQQQHMIRVDYTANDPVKSPLASYPSPSNEVREPSQGKIEVCNGSPDICPNVIRSPGNSSKSNVAEVSQGLSSLPAHASYCPVGEQSVSEIIHDNCNDDIKMKPMNLSPSGKSTADDSSRRGFDSEAHYMYTGHAEGGYFWLYHPSKHNVSVPPYVPIEGSNITPEMSFSLGPPLLGSVGVEEPGHGNFYNSRNDDTGNLKWSDRSHFFGNLPFPANVGKGPYFSEMNDPSFRRPEEGQKALGARYSTDSGIYHAFNNPHDQYSEPPGAYLPSKQPYSANMSNIGPSRSGVNKGKVSEASLNPNGSNSNKHLPEYDSIGGVKPQGRFYNGSRELPHTERKTGKRKRRGNTAVHRQAPKKEKVSRKATAGTLEISGVRKSTRKRKRLVKD